MVSSCIKKRFVELQISSTVFPVGFKSLYPQEGEWPLKSIIEFSNSESSIWYGVDTWYGLKVLLVGEVGSRFNVKF